MLIDKTEIAVHREISTSLRDAKINPFINDAEFLDVRPLLGADFYTILKTDFAEAIFQDILLPKEYTYNGKQYSHAGLNKVLSLYSYSRYILHGGFTDTSHGFVEKSSQDSQAVSESQKRNIHKQDRQAARQYFDDIGLFISRFPDVYPTFRSGCSTVSNGGFRMTKITK